MLVLDSHTCYLTAARRLHLKLMVIADEGGSLQLPRTYFYRDLVITRLQIGLENIQAHQCVGNYTQITVF